MITQRQIINHGKILEKPLRQPENTTHSVGYELGYIFQLDNTHALLVASMDEQGGHDMCVGNDMIVFNSISDIQPENAVPLNRPEKKLSNGNEVLIAKYPATGCFVSRDFKSKCGQKPQYSGTGILCSFCLTFDGKEKRQIGNSSVEITQITWDGSSIKINEQIKSEELMGIKIIDIAMGHWLADEDYILAPFTTQKGIVVFKFKFTKNRWEAVEHGNPFCTFFSQDTAAICGEMEPSIQKYNDKYYVYTRGNDPVGRLYVSTDGLNYSLLNQRYNNMVPQVLNKGLYDDLYIATNPNMDILRNPLIAYPFVEESFNTPNFFAEPVIIHDQDGIRDAKGKTIPFVDHPVGQNIFLEGKWHHFITYRVCDLRERTVDENLLPNKDMIGLKQPSQRSDFGGLYLAEIRY